MMMEKLHRMATALVLIFFYIETEHLSEASSLFRSVRSPDRMLDLNYHNQRQQLCGESLTEALNLACQGSFNHMFKKSSEDATERELWDILRESSTYPYRSRQLAKALIPGVLRRQRRGVVDECCKNSCTIAEMMQYCSN